MDKQSMDALLQVLDGIKAELKHLEPIAGALVKIDATIYNAFADPDGDPEPTRRIADALEEIAQGVTPDDDPEYGFVNGERKPLPLQRLVAGTDRIERRLAELGDEWRDLAERRSSSRG